MWPVVSRSFLVPSYWDDFPDVMDVAFRCPFEDKFFDSLMAAPNDDIFAIKVYVGNYTTDDIKWHIEGSKLQITGIQTHQTKYGNDKSEFSREFDLPSNVLKDTLRHYVTSDGILVIEGKKRIDVRYPFQDNSDKNHFEIVVDVQGFSQNEIQVNLHQKNLVIEGSHSTDKKTGKTGKLQTKSFKRVVTIPVDVDESTLELVRDKEQYLVVKAKRNQKQALAGPKRLSISQG
uniref:Heat shock protein Hsp-16.48/Hsp-16.49 n=1 Tax=Salmo salar TaxID=8030 RepID=B9EM16_SALSA|nr:Heat shock protein Hsp-16.48/Hsp-16.49 [Salmo salar]ACM08563.1 Heat shock protein Hsp-16.48/Hsp-16.49 [Salmo salar]